MADDHDSSDGRRRYLIATGVTRDLPRSRQRLIDSVERVTRLFTSQFGYQRVTTLNLDPTAEEIRGQVRDFCEGREPGDIVAYYHTGHAEAVPLGHRLRTGGTGNRYVTSVPTAELAELMLEGTAVQHVLIIIDSCFAGQGGAEALLAGMWVSGPAQDKTLTVVTAAHPDEQVRAGDFAELFEEAVRHPATAGHEPAYLSLSAVVGHIRDNPRRPRWQTVSESVLFNRETIQPFLPNPRFDPQLHGLDLFTQMRVQQRQLRTEDMRSHFLPRARGTDAPGEDRWRFVGRYAALRSLATWLGDDTAGSRVEVVTGDPGSGKSAVIGRVVVLADPQRRASVPLDGVPDDTLPAAGTIDVAVHARGLTTGQVLAALSVAAGTRAQTTGEFLTAVRGKRLLAVVDAIDESVDPRDLVDRLLRPLADSAGHTGLRLLLGTRRHLIGALGPDATVLDLDAEAFADPASVRAYAARCLRDTRADSPYVTAAPEVVSAVADAIAEAAGRSFLVTLIAARTLALLRHIPDPDDADWRASLPRTAADAMHNDLQSRLYAHADKARDLLRPLAYASGAGLPWEDIWAAIATAISQRHYTDEDIIWLCSEAGYYIVEAQQAGRSVYRLYHAALAEYLRHGHDDGKTNSVIVDFLTEHTKLVCASSTPDWQRAHPYTRAHMATHAARARKLDSLMLDPGFLLAAETSGILAVLPAAQSLEASRAGAAYQRALHHLGQGPVGRQQSYLELSSHRCGADALRNRLADFAADRPWRVLWTQWPVEHAHRVLTTDRGSPIVHLDGIAVPGRSPLILAVSEAGWHIWNPVTGEQLSGIDGRIPLASADSALSADGTLLLATIDYTSKIRVYDITHARPRYESAPRRRWARVNYWMSRALGTAAEDLATPPLICAQLPDGTPVAVIVRDPGLAFLRKKKPAVEIWDVDTGMLMRQARLEPARASFPQLPVIVSSGLKNGMVVALLDYWTARYAVNLSSGEQLDVKLEPDEETSQETIYIRPKNTSTEWQRFLPAPQTPESWNSEIASGSLTFRAEGESIRVGSNAGESQEFRLVGHTEPITAIIALTSSGPEQAIVSGSRDGTIRIWPGPFTGKQKKRSLWADDIAHFSVLTLPGGNLLGATAGNSHSSDYDQVRLWDFTSGTPTAAFQLPSPVSALECMWTSPETPAVITYGTDQFIRAWNMYSRELIFEEYADLDSFATQISGTLLPGGRSIFVAVGHNNSAAALWDASGKFLKWLKGHTGWVSGVFCTVYRGRNVAVTAGHDQRICLWTLPEGDLLRRFRPLRLRADAMPLREARSVLDSELGDSHPVLAEIGDDQPVAITRCSRGTVHIWNALNWKHIFALNKNYPPTLHFGCTETTGHQLLIITADDDASLRVWLLSLRKSPQSRKSYTRRLIDRIDIESRVLGIRVSPDCTLLLNTGHGLAAIRLNVEAMLGSLPPE